MYKLHFEDDKAIIRKVDDTEYTSCYYCGSQENIEELSENGLCSNCIKELD